MPIFKEITNTYQIDQPWVGSLFLGRMQAADQPYFSFHSISLLPIGECKGPSCPISVLLGQGWKFNFLLGSVDTLVSRWGQFEQSRMVNIKNVFCFVRLFFSGPLDRVGFVLGLFWAYPLVIPGCKFLQCLIQDIWNKK